MHNRHCHIMKPNEGTKLPNNILAFDTESTHDVNKEGDDMQYLAMGTAMYSTCRGRKDWTNPERLLFHDVGTFWDWVIAHTSPSQALYTYCFNANYDLLILDFSHELPARGWHFHRVIFKSSPVIVKATKGKRTIWLLDATNWFKGSLKSWGNQIGLPKLTMPEQGAPAGDWNTYCFRDTEIVLRLMQGWLAEVRANDWGSFGKTIASQSLHAYRHKYMKHRIVLAQYRQADDFCQSTYVGGRTEAFTIGHITHPISTFDVNSMYPYVMRDGVFPTKLVGKCQSAGIAEVKRWIGKYAVFARAHVRTTRPLFPYKQNHRLTFPTGKFWVNLAPPELELAINRGLVDKISRGFIYDRAPLFHGFVVDLFNLRLAAKKAGDKTKSKFIKLIMNSLYGKFGQRGFKQLYEEEVLTDAVAAWEVVDPTTQTVIYHTQFGHHHEASIVDGFASCAMPAIAATVTSYARVHLLHIIETAGWEHVHYCDTDCVWVDSEVKHLLTPFLDEYELGKLKNEANSNDTVIYGLKDYQLGTTEKHKGISSKATKVNNSTYTQPQFRRFTGALREGQLRGVLVRSVTKHLTRNYTKGTIGQNGRVSPYVLSEPL